MTSYAPATGEVLGDAPLASAEEIRAVVERARRAQESWGALSAVERGLRLLRFRDALLERADELALLIAREVGKPRAEALLHEVVLLAIEVAHLARVAPGALAPRAARLRWLPHRRGRLLCVPRPVVAVLAPWSSPLLIPFGDAMAALAAGSAVVVKPSESAPLVARRAKQLWDASSLPEDVLGLVLGGPATGAALLEAGVSHVVFTGGVAEGRRVAAGCAERLVPCTLKLTGRSPVLACSDADVERVSLAVAHGATTHAGQSCLQVGPIYAHRAVHDALLERVVARVRGLRLGDPASEHVDLGGLVSARAAQAAQRLLDDAIAKGAVVRCGGLRAERPSHALEPTVLSGCDHSMAVVTHDAPGPLVAFMRVSTDEEAVRLVNSLPLRRCASVYSRDRQHARGLARRIDARSVLVNDVPSPWSCPEVPGGVPFLRGAEGMRTVCDVRLVSHDLVALPRDPTGRPYTDRGYALLRAATRLVLPRGGLVSRLARLL